MGKITFILCLGLTIFGLSSADGHHRAGTFLEHDKTVVNCAKYKREANQHSCVLSTFNSEGPYFLGDDLERSDITEGQSGVLLDLTINLVNSNDCTPLSNMYVHIWQANATGSYSGVGPLGPGDFPMNHGPGDHKRPTPINNERFCRGYQISNSEGQTQFKTVIPGWYGARSLHIHLEVYPNSTTEQNDILYVGQIFFKRELAYELKLVEPYSTNQGRITPNEEDHAFTAESMVALVSDGQNGYKSSITFGLNPVAKKAV